MITYTTAEQRDLPLLFQLNRQLIDTYEDTSTIDYGNVLLWVQQNLASHLTEFHRILFHGQLAGFYCLTCGELDSFFILPEYQGMGIGTEVLKHCQRQSSSLFLYVFRRNHRAIALYSRMGFHITKEVGKTRYIMEWKNQDL